MGGGRERTEQTHIRFFIIIDDLACEEGGGGAHLARKSYPHIPGQVSYSVLFVASTHAAHVLWAVI